jgi:hypothetical protein
LCNQRFIQLLWQRQLHEDAVNRRIGVKFVNQAEHLVLGCVGGQRVLD